MERSFLLNFFSLESSLQELKLLMKCSFPVSASSLNNRCRDHVVVLPSPDLYFVVLLMMIVLLLPHWWREIDNYSIIRRSTSRAICSLHTKVSPNKRDKFKHRESSMEWKFHRSNKITFAPWNFHSQCGTFVAGRLKAWKRNVRE